MRAGLVLAVVSFALPAIAEKIQPAEKTQAGDDTTGGRTLATSLVSGNVESFDRESGKLLVQAGGRREEFVLDDQATVFHDGRLGQLGDVAAGKAVRLAWELRGDLRAVRWVEVLGAKTPPRRSEATVGGVSGTVVSRDVTRRLLVVRQGAAEWSLAIDEGASIVVQGAPAGLDALVPGDEVRAHYESGVPGVLRIERVAHERTTEGATGATPAK